jgi:hypothetical protein
MTTPTLPIVEAEKIDLPVPKEPVQFPEIWLVAGCWKGSWTNKGDAWLTEGGASNRATEMRENGWTAVHVIHIPARSVMP